MAKVGRNDPCPCGSGKKYKHCHWSQNQGAAPVQNKRKAETKSPFQTLVENYHPEPIIKLIGALQLLPQNHFQGAALENLARLTLLQRRQNDTRPFASWQRLAAVFQTMGYYNDEPSNLFTENVVSTEGNHVVYPGIYYGVANIVNELLELLFAFENDMPKAFTKSVRDGAGILLFISQKVAQDKGHRRYLTASHAENDKLHLADYDAAMDDIEAIRFSKSYLKEACDLYRFEYTALQEFILPLHDADLSNDDPDENPVSAKPLVEMEDDIVLYMPTTVANSILRYIYRKAKEHGCYEGLIGLLCQHQFENTCKALVKMQWVATGIELPEKNPALPITETVFQFDIQKFGYLCFVNVGGRSKQPWTITDLHNRNEQVVSYLSALVPEQPYQVLTLSITAETGQDGFFSWQKSSSGNQTTAFAYSELMDVAYTKGTNRLSLWKFAKTYTRTSEQMKIMSMGGALDAYAIWKQNNGSLLHSDEANPVGGMMMIVPGSSSEFHQDVLQKRDEHAVELFTGKVLGYTKVVRQKDFAPIYTDKFVHVQHRMVIENFKMPVWVTNYQSKHPNNETWAHHICEAIAFWFQKMEKDLKPILEELTLVQFELEIIVDEGLLRAEQFERKEIDLSKVAIDVTIKAPRIKLFVPFDFLYLVQQPDNAADKLLMKAALKGIAVYVREAKGDLALSGEQIEEIVDKALRPSGAKMVLFTDTSEDVRRDNRGLPSMRYIQETDVSFVLDNLVSYLPAGYAIPATIATLEAKIQLCDDLVTALIAQVKTRIEQFDGERLVAWLIRANEKCIQVREMREIHIPAKIACFSSFEAEVKELLEKGESLVTTGHALRTLIEWVATALPTGIKLPNDDDIDEMLALTNQVINWGALSEAMRFGLSNPRMGHLPSGRIGSDKTMERQILEPYGKAKTESDIFQYVEKFEKNYRKGTDGTTSLEKTMEKLDEAFDAEFGLTLTRLTQIIIVLRDDGFKSSEGCVKREENLVKEILKTTIDGIADKEINTALELLTLLQRPAIGRPPKGYNNIDIFPWRFNRPLSYLRRPLVHLKQNKNVIYCYGYRHLMTYIDNLYFLLFNGKLPENKSNKMRTWIAATLAEKGRPYRDNVRDWLQDHTSLEVIDYEVSIKPGGHLSAEKDYGDIDVLAIDHTNKIIYPVECKNIMGARNVHEMKVEMDLYLGREGKEKKAKITKHVERDKWLKANKAALTKFVERPEEYEVKSFILTADEMPLPLLKSDSLPLPIKSFVFLRKDGLAALSDL